LLQIKFHVSPTTSATCISYCITMADKDSTFMPYYPPSLDRQLFSPERSICPQLSQDKQALLPPPTFHRLPKDIVGKEPTEICVYFMTAIRPFLKTTFRHAPTGFPPFVTFLLYHDITHRTIQLSKLTSIRFPMRCLSKVR
jgi:hypothetical protein